MSEARRDLLSTLERLGEEKRSGRLTLRGENWSASISLNGGVVSSVNVEPATAWRLGELLRYVRILSPQRYRRAARVARKQGELAAESLVLRKGWVAEPVYRRFQERLCVQRVFELAARVGYRAVFNAKEGGGDGLPTDVAVPVPFIANALADRHREAMMDNEPLPRGDICFRKTGAAISHILGGEGHDVFDGAPLMALTSSDRRVFFFCNGEIPFRDLSLVLGVSPHLLGQSLRNLSKLNAIYQQSGQSRWALWAKGVRSASRPLLAFVGGILVVALVLGVATATLVAVGDRSTRDLSFERGGYFKSGEGVVRKSVGDALQGYYLSYGTYPDSLDDLVETGHFSAEWLHRQVLPRRPGYEVDEDDRGCSLSLAGRRIAYRGGRFRPAPKPTESEEQE